MKPKIAVVGAGAIGGYFGAKLAAAGANVVLIDGWAMHVEAVRKDGMRISGIGNEPDLELPVRILHLNDVQSLGRESRIDICIVATKSYDTAWAAMMMKPYMASDGFFVSMQNGINEETLSDVVGWGKVVGCVVMISAELIGPGHVLRTMPQQTAPLVEFEFGELHGRRTSRIDLLVGLTRHFDAARTTANLWGQRWSKLCINAMHNGISAITGLNGKDRESIAAIREAELAIGCETVRIGRALGYSFDHIGRFSADALAGYAGGDSTVRDAAHAWLISGSIGAPRSARQRPSLAQDIAKGRQTEIDYLNGYVVDQAGAVGLSAPANAAVVRLVKRLESATIGPDIKHVAEIPL